MRKVIIVLLNLFLLVCCSHHRQKNKIQSQVQIGKDLQSSRYDSIYFSEQPKMEDFYELKKTRL